MSTWTKMYKDTDPTVIEPNPDLPAVKESEPTFADFDMTNPRSLINLLPPNLQGLIQQLPTKYYEMDEDELRKECFDQGEPDQAADRLRISFWDEYDRAQRLFLEKMEMRNVCKGVCTEIYFYRRFAVDPKKLAYLLHPPSEYQIDLKDLHALSLRSLRTALKLPIVDGKGRPNVKLIEAQNKIFQHLDLRLKGAIIQRIDQRNVNVNVDATPDTSSTVNKVTKMSMDEIEQRLKTLQSDSTRMLTPTQVKVDLLKDLPTSQEVQHVVANNDSEVEVVTSEVAGDTAGGRISRKL